ncbi:MAG: hypothetical protein IJJ47_02385 [Methanosphaera sp.]|nr:hypothetical protein [Methanosphaera sp.]
MSNFNKCTCVKVNKEKMDLIKAKGLNLQDLLDKAMNEELNLNNMPDKEQKIEEILTKIEKLEKERDKSIADCDKKIDILIKNLIESRNNEEQFYNKQIKVLKLELEYLKQQ